MYDLDQVWLYQLTLITDLNLNRGVKLSFSYELRVRVVHE